MQIALKEATLHLRNSYTRMPFRFGNSCLTACPQATLRVVIEANGKRQAGYAGDMLPPGWFDKAPDKPYPQQIDEMIEVIDVAREAYLQTFEKPTKLFPAWREAYTEVQAYAKKRGLPLLLGSFGSSMVERALLDATARAANLSFNDAIKQNIYEIIPGDIHPDLADLVPKDWLPAKPAQSLPARHTVGMVDPLTQADIPPDERLDDGLPQSLEEYVSKTGVRYIKIKVANNLEHDLERIKTIAQIVEQHRGDDYNTTLDGNELYKTAEDFDVLVDRIKGSPELETFWKNTLSIEQPLPRGISLDPDHTEGIRALSRTKPVIIDESDESLDSYPRALELGYGGTSSKACKGPIKSILNAGLTWLHNERGTRDDYIMTGEDLTCVGVVSLQTDICLIAMLGLSNIEKNGHHYYRGLSYMPEAEQRAALDAHPDLYRELNAVVCPRLEDGKFDIASLQCHGFGFNVEPDVNAMQTPDEWNFASLGL